MQTETRSLSDKVWLVLKGLAMGAANKVPGVSGGVVAYVAGFYEEFIYSLQKVNGKALRLLFGGRFRSFWQYINGRFLGLLILGMLISYFSVSLLLDLAIRNYPLLVWSAFFGMIIGSIYYIGKDFEEWTNRNIVMLISGVIFGVAISLMEPAQENDNLLFVFICGIIGVSGMTLPGLSGSFILILLGNYVLLLVDSVNALFVTITKTFSGDFSFIDDPIHMRLLIVLAVFALGSLTGLVTISHFLTFLLKKFKWATNAAILGFIIGSLGVVWPWKTEVFERDLSGEIALDINGTPILDNYDRYLPTAFNIENVLAIFFILAGIFMVVALGKYGERTRRTS
jgi:putative membrane protein